MCGILLNIGDDAILDNDPALNIIEHRGPDAYGATSFKLDKFQLSLGHRRLSIIDLSDRGKQPMSYENERYWMTYNGEIYNYLEIKAELKNKGCEFVSDSDSEVLIASFATWGIDALYRFNGMFAFSIYDKQTRKLTIVRDRYGIKPLYYINTPKTFRACSEIKQITTLKEYSPKVNLDKLYHFLNTGDFAFDHETMWQDVYELLPGHYIELDLNSWKPGDALHPIQWYKFPEEIDYSLSFEDACSEFRRLLDQSVKFRLRADVPVGFLLSGGLDSSTLVGLAHNQPGVDQAGLRVYSSCYENSPIDEREYINAVVESTKADACFHFPQPEDIVKSFDKVIWHNDIPIVQGSPVPHSLIYEHIKHEKEDRIVILEGQGADEILCGYGDFYWAYLYQLFKPASIGEFLKQFRIYQKNHHQSLKIIIRKWLRMRNPQGISYPANAVLNARYFYGDGSVPPRPINREEASVEDLHKNRLKILRYILHNVDRNSMSQSRETRVPFLDHNLVEFCLKLPPSYKIHDGLSKRVLRNSVDDILPDKVKNRVDKQGYSSPVSMWAKQGLQGFFESELKKVADLPFVNNKKMNEMFINYKQNGGYFDPILWRLIAAEHWMTMFGIDC